VPPDRQEITSGLLSVRNPTAAIPGWRLAIRKNTRQALYRPFYVVTVADAHPRLRVSKGVIRSPAIIIENHHKRRAQARPPKSSGCCFNGGRHSVTRGADRGSVRAPQMSRRGRCWLTTGHAFRSGALLAIAPLRCGGPTYGGRAQGGTGWISDAAPQVVREFSDSVAMQGSGFVHPFTAKTCGSRNQSAMIWADLSTILRG